MSTSDQDKLYQIKPNSKKKNRKMIIESDQQPSPQEEKKSYHSSSDQQSSVEESTPSWNTLFTPDSDSHFTFHQQFQLNGFPHKKVKLQSKPKAKNQSKTKVIKSQNTDHKNSTDKDFYVYQVLKRWWYVMQDWPPKDFDYVKQLENQGYRIVKFQNWRKQPQILMGRRKVYEIQAWTGLYKSSNVLNDKQQIVDVRPKQGIPSYQNLRRKTKSQLKNMVIIGYKNQIEQLQKVYPKQVRQQKLVVQLKQFLSLLQK